MKVLIPLVVLLLIVISVVTHFRMARHYNPVEWHPQLPSNPKTIHSVSSSKQGSTCLQTYQEFFDPSPIDIRIAFGYKDARPARLVSDRYEKIAFIQALLSPCLPNFHACGFYRDSDDADLLIKWIKGPKNKLKTIHLRITHSSVGPDDDENRKDPFQKWQSRQAEQNFLQGLQKAHAIFYNGHSRDGGGPDFYPPRLTKDQGVNYYWYQLKKPGLKRMVRELDKSSSQTKLLGLFSCVSTRHFSREIFKVRPDVGLITSPNLIYYTDAFKNLLGTLSALLGQWCRKDFNDSIQAESAQKGSILKGFFQ